MRMTMVLAGALLAVGLAGPALASDADCYTSQDGNYPCDFQILDSSGSFRIEGDGVPTFILTIDEPGVAFGSGIYEPGGRSVTLPGLFYRSEEDRACWINDSTDFEICAY